MPLRARLSCALPTRTNTLTDAVCRCGIGSATTRTPLGRVSISGGGVGVGIGAWRSRASINHSAPMALRHAASPRPAK
jgi:hypothetical protein